MNSSSPQGGGGRMLEPYETRVAGAICGKSMPRIKGDQALFANRLQMELNMVRYYR